MTARRLLTVAEADAIANRYKPTARTGITPGTPLTLEAHRQITATRQRPITDTAQRNPIRVIGGQVRTINDAATEAEMSAARKRRTK